MGTVQIEYYFCVMNVPTGHFGPIYSDYTRSGLCDGFAACQVGLVFGIDFLLLSAVY
jgi:hypothetical protein